MTTRSSLRLPALLLAVFALAASAPSPVVATTLEGTAYGGSSPGGWTCGPGARVNYGGLSGRARIVTPNGRFGERGLSAEVMAGAEREDVVVDCSEGDGCADEAEAKGPPTRLLGGGEARIGYHFEQFGVAAGAGAFQAWGGAADQKPDWYAFPSVVVSAGQPSSFRVVGGLGAPTPSSPRRPAAFCGADLGISSAVTAELRASVQRAGPSPGDEAV
ncbi:MAG: hypothetical protein FJ104_05550, partial [Deltaproteobacteria bacterium]|nr:hypothetical protein [Deltaproteobacteria bacterium]